MKTARKTETEKLHRFHKEFSTVLVPRSFVLFGTDLVFAGCG
jgi:hypothetical protein